VIAGTRGRDSTTHAEKSLEVAELVAGEHEIPESRSVAAALAVLAGIAAADAACCAALGRRSRRDDHRQAAALLREIVDGESCRKGAYRPARPASRSAARSACSSLQATFCVDNEPQA
jgi:hypothetical protein